MWQADLYFSLETERENSGNGKFSTFASCLDSDEEQRDGGGSGREDGICC